jgi:hypothetical protein
VERSYMALPATLVRFYPKRRASGGINIVTIQLILSFCSSVLSY